MRIAPEILARFAHEVLLSAGTTDGQAAATVRAMMHATLHGIDSHGVRLLGFYVDSLAKGYVKPDPQVTVSKPGKAAVLVDAGGGFGHFATYLAVEEACAIASEFGIGMAAVKNSTHFGAAGAYTLAAAEAGYIALAACNSGALVVLHGGRETFHGTNPLSFAAPLRGQNPFLLDMATSAIAWNRVRRYQESGGSLPAESALDQSGQYAIDASAAVALAPLGGKLFGYKGAGLAGMAEVLGAMLTGMNLSFEEEGRGLGPSRIGHFLAVIDPAAFIAREEFENRLKTYLEAVARQSVEGGPVYAAGGPEWEARDDRVKHGIPLDRGLLHELSAVGARLNVAFPS
jgi:LDH2 family malate/lactate/ureidoglycolate dehydrogenase